MGTAVTREAAVIPARSGRGWQIPAVLAVSLVLAAGAFGAAYTLHGSTTVSRTPWQGGGQVRLLGPLATPAVRVSVPVVPIPAVRITPKAKPTPVTISNGGGGGTTSPPAYNPPAYNPPTYNPPTYNPPATKTVPAPVVVHHHGP